MKFRLLRGCHAEGRYPQGHRLAGRSIEYIPGDVVESNSDLAVRFNAPGSLGRKFDPVPEDTPVTDKTGKKEVL
jgi:hypothetical protein